MANIQHVDSCAYDFELRIQNAVQTHSSTVVDLAFYVLVLSSKFMFSYSATCPHSNLNSLFLLFPLSLIIKSAFFMAMAQISHKSGIGRLFPDT